MEQTGCTHKNKARAREPYILYIGSILIIRTHHMVTCEGVYF